MHERENPDGRPPAAGEEYGAVIEHGDFDNDGLVDMAVIVPGDDSGSGSVVIYKGIVFEQSGRTAFARVHLIQNVVATDLAWTQLDNGTLELLVGGNFGFGPEVRALDMSSNDFSPVFRDSIPFTDPRNDGNPLMRPSGGAYSLDLLSEFGAQIETVSYTVFTGGAFVSQTLIAVGAPSAHAFNTFDDTTLAGVCATAGGDPTLKDCDERTGAVFLYDQNLALVGVLDPYTLGTAGNRAEARFGDALAIGRIDTEPQYCPSVVVGAPQDYVVQDVAGLVMSVNPVPGSTTGYGVGDPVWIGAPGASGRAYAFTTSIPSLCVPPPVANPWLSSPWLFDARSFSPHVPGEEFGSSLAVGPVDTDRTFQLDDVVVGAPGGLVEVVTDVFEPAGAVYVYAATPSLVDTDPTTVDTWATRLTVADATPTGTCGASPGDDFGLAVEVGDFASFTGLTGTAPPPTEDIAVGAPGRAMCSIGQPTGGVYSFTGSSGGYAALSEYRLNLAGPCNPRSPGTTDRFGEALSYQPLGRYNVDPGNPPWAPDAIPYDSSVISYPYGQTDLWMGAPGADSGSGASAVEGGTIQSVRGFARRQGVQLVYTCY